MDRKGFLGLLGLGAVGAAIPKVVEADEAPVGGSWWKEDDWTVVRVPVVLAKDLLFEPHLLVPGCPKALCVATGAVVVGQDRHELVDVTALHTATDSVGTWGNDYHPQSGPFAVMWPDQFVALLSAGWDGPLPLKYNTGPVTGVELPRRRGHMTLGWRSIGVENIGVEDLNFAP